MTNRLIGFVVAVTVPAGGSSHAYIPPRTPDGKPRYTRIGPDALRYEVTVEDPTI